MFGWFKKDTRPILVVSPEPKEKSISSDAYELAGSKFHEIEERFWDQLWAMAGEGEVVDRSHVKALADEWFSKIPTSQEAED